MDQEINLDSIRALEDEIQEHERAVIQLKRARNALLNVSTLPPEILGKIFHYNLILDGDFSGLPKTSYNFLLVCHHWFWVASGTPELWSFWGNSIEDWARRCARCGTASLDLVLSRPTDGHLDDTLRDALQGVLYETRYDGFISRAPTQNSSTPSSLPSSPKGRKFGRTA
jgi:hypothetical protein